MTKHREITVSYKDNDDDVTATYSVTEETLRRAKSWQIRTNPTGKDLADWLRSHGAKYHRVDGPAILRRKADGSTSETYCINGKYHRVGGPAYILRRTDGSGSEMYYIKDKVHRSDGPAMIERMADGSVRESYYANDELHRADGPAVIEHKADGSVYRAYYTEGTFLKDEVLSTKPVARKRPLTTACA